MRLTKLVLLALREAGVPGAGRQPINHTNRLEKAMKIHLLALIGLAVGFVTPSFGQQKDMGQPKMAEEIRALGKKYDEAFDKNDAEALGTLYSEDAVRRTPHGTFSGRPAIERDYAEFAFQQYHSNNFVITVDQVNPDGNDVQVTGKWSCAVQKFGTHHVKGHFSWGLVREGDSWKIRTASYETSGHD